MAKKKKAKAQKKPKQRRLAGMEDAKIEKLESLAEEYADIRDKRLALTPEEVRLNKEIVAAMKAAGKTHYLHAGVEITITHEKEKAKVTLYKEED